MINFKNGNIKKAKLKKDWGIKLEDSILRNADIDDTDLDGEKVMMNLDKGEYFMLNEVGSRIWEIVEDEITVKGIVDKLIEEYEVDEETCKDTVVEFLGKLNKAELVTVK